MNGGTFNTHCPRQPPTVSMPVRWLRNLEHERGAIIATLKCQCTGDDMGEGMEGLPVILTSRGRRHRNQFTHGRKNTKVTNPHNDETVDDTSCAAIVETLGEEDENSFPGNEDGTREAKNRKESKVALQPSVNHRNQ